MDLKEEMESQSQFEMELYTKANNIIFSKINDADSQEKLTLFLMEVAEFGLHQLLFHGLRKKNKLQCPMENLGDSKEQRDKIEAINSDIEQISKDTSLCKELLEKINIDRTKLMKRFGLGDSEDEEEEEKEDGRPNLCEFNLEMEKVPKTLEPDVYNQKLQDSFNALEIPKTHINKPLEEPREKFEEYSPFNDPHNEFGWKESMNTRTKLQYENDKLSLEQNKTLDTPMQVTDDKPSSGDRGTESKENSLSPLNSSNQSKGSSVPKDSGISSDETSTCPERNSVKIDYSKVKKTLERIMGTDEKQQPSLGSNDGQKKFPFCQDNYHEYEILSHRALLDFCERHLLHPPDDYLLLGLAYVRLTQTDVALRN